MTGGGWGAMQGGVQGVGERQKQQEGDGGDIQDGRRWGEAAPEHDLPICR